MRSKALWLTDLGLTEIGSGVLSPGLDPINLRFYPPFGMGFNEWVFEVGVLKGNNPIKYFTVDGFNDTEKYFDFTFYFETRADASTIQIFTLHQPTNFKGVMWEGEILPNEFHLSNKVIGHSGKNWNVIDEITSLYPSIDLRYFKIPAIKIDVPQTSILVSSAKSVEEHTLDNAPITITGFHPLQEFNLDVYGFVIGYGGKGGDAGMSTVTDEVDIVYPTDAKNGGNPIYIEHATQTVDITVHRHGCFLPGQGGKGASGFLINHPERRVEQIGHPGIGGYPNGLNGEVTDIHYKLNLVKKNEKPYLKSFGRGFINYSFEPGQYEGHKLSSFLKSGTCIKNTKDGVSGSMTPPGVRNLRSEGSQFCVKQLIYAYGIYVEI